MKLYSYVIATVLFGCAIPYDKPRYQRTAHAGPVIWPKGNALDGFACEGFLHASAEVGLALEATLYSFDAFGYLPYNNLTLEKLGFYKRNSLEICFVASNKLGVAGRSRERIIWVSLGDKDGISMDIKATALVHELIHQVLWRACLLPRCDEDGEHADLRFWGGQYGSVEERAMHIWASGK